MPPGYEVNHGDDLDTALDSRLAGYERHNRADFKMNCLSDRDSIHARRDMSVEKPPEFKATHDDDLDTALDSRQAGYERHNRLRFRNGFLF